MSQFRSQAAARKAATQRAAEWRKALVEGRVVRSHDGERFQSFKTSAEAQAFVAANPFTHVVTDYR
jgi:hypothetical protein